jgi:hypothetical protein
VPSIESMRQRITELSKRIVASEDAAEVIRLRSDQDKLLDRLASLTSVARLPEGRSR